VGGGPPGPAKFHFTNPANCRRSCSKGKKAAKNTKKQ
jgi:hypothetical protein